MMRNVKRANASGDTLCSCLRLGASSNEGALRTSCARALMHGRVRCAHYERDACRGRLSDACRVVTSF